MAKGKEEFIPANTSFQVLSIALNVAEEKNEQSRVKELEEFLDNQELEIESYDEELVRKLVDNIVVYDEMLKVIFKFGIEILIDK